jgi:pimeloyl-ACP methyl ester carboxylesterase
MLFFQLPWLPERAVRAGGWAVLRHPLEHDARSGAFTSADIALYVRAWSHPGAATAMINYYRAAMRPRLSRTQRRIEPLEAPVLVVWGERDRHLSRELAEPDHGDVPNLTGVVRLPNASHWVHQDEPERVTELLIAFFRE